ncbi:MAG: HAMP domain-containing histidine kinase [Eubacterium sp.]|jgi:signal transduction histidine kinase|nr:HAMP domain-containing histidine kinase [Eubacterium sp.]
MKKFFNSIRFKVWILFIGFALGLLGFSYFNQVVALPVFYNRIKTQESMQTVNFLKNKWGSSEFNNHVTRLAAEQEMMISVLIPNPITGIHEVYIQDPNGSYYFASREPGLTDDLKQKLFSTKNGVFTDSYSNNNRSVLYTVALVGSPNQIKGYIIINNFIEPLTNTRNVLKRQFFINIYIVLLFAVILSAFVVVRISNPIISISKKANMLAKGEFNYDLKPNDYTEIKNLANNLNQASSEIAKTENLRKDLIANVSHDLKTPLTMIKAYAEMIRDLSGDNPTKREQHLKVIIDEADHLNTLVVDMLDLSMLQSGVSAPHSEGYDFSANLRNMIHRFDYFIEDGLYTFKTEIENGIVIKADAKKLDQVVYNLINNAINYTGPDGLVTIRLTRADGKCRFEVIDTGRGISKEEQPLIWERYYKGERSENHKRATVGTGLGLSIVKSVLDSHGFAYGVESALGEGSVFWFEAPTF